MALELTDWDRDLPSQGDEEYQALVRTLNFTEGFGLLFVRCSPAGGEQLITKVKEDITNKNIEVIRLEQAVNNLYEIIDSSTSLRVNSSASLRVNNKKEINILFITGLEHSFYEYEECKSFAGWNRVESREDISPRPSQLDPGVRLSPHPAPDVLSFCVC